jgi:hypothetical protein
MEDQQVTTEKGNEFTANLPDGKTYSFKLETYNKSSPECTVLKATLYKDGVLKPC